MPTSQQKKRHRSRRGAEEDALVELLQQFASTRSGVTCETEMAGDWNSLGIAITVPGSFTGRDVFELGNALITLLASSKKQLGFTFSWSAGIYQDGTLLKAFNPNSQHKRLCEVCGYTQEHWLGDSCLACKSALSS